MIKIDTTARVIVPSDVIGALEVSELLGLSRSQVTRRAHAGLLPVLARLWPGAAAGERTDTHQRGKQ